MRATRRSRAAGRDRSTRSWGGVGAWPDDAGFGRSCASGRNDTVRYDPDMPAQHRVAALAYDGLAPFELGVAVEAFAVRRLELDVHMW